MATLPPFPGRPIDEGELASLSLQEFLSQERRFGLIALCREVQDSYDAFRGVALARMFEKFVKSGEVNQLSEKDRRAFNELYDWALFGSLEVQPNEVAAEVLERSTLLLLRDGVNVAARLIHVLLVWGEMDGTVVYRKYLLQAIRRNKEKLGSINIPVPGEPSVEPTVPHWIEAYDRFARHQARTGIDRARFVSQHEAAKTLSEKEKEVLLGLLETVDELLLEPTTLRGTALALADSAAASPASSERFVTQYVGRPLHQQDIRQAQERIVAERAQGRNVVEILSEAAEQEHDVDVAAVLFLLARDRKLGALLKDSSFRTRLTSYASVSEQPRILVKNVLDRAAGNTDDSAQLGAQLASLLVAQGEREYLGMVVYSQASGKYEWRV